MRKIIAFIGLVLLSPVAVHAQSGQDISKQLWVDVKSETNAKSQFPMITSKYYFVYQIFLRSVNSLEIETARILFANGNVLSPA
jgi:hypothetical protein